MGNLLWRQFRNVRVAFVAILVAILAGSVALPASANAAPIKSGCFEADKAQLAKFRASIDDLVQNGTISRARGDSYKCDPRLATQHLVTVVTVEQPEYRTLDACGGGFGIEVQAVDSITGDTIITARQSLYWCWNGATVYNWGGECTGWASGYGGALGWSFDGCNTNDYIPYNLGGNYPGGVHHYTGHYFTNIYPWVFNVTLHISIWGHYDGTADVECYCH